MGGGGGVAYRSQKKSPESENVGQERWRVLPERVPKTVMFFWTRSWRLAICRLRPTCILTTSLGMVANCFWGPGEKNHELR